MEYDIVEIKIMGNMNYGLDVPMMYLEIYSSLNLIFVKII